MRKLPVGEAECAGFPVRYSLLVETLRGGLELYGVQVDYRAQTAALPGLTVFRRRAEELAELLMRGRVTPATAWDVAEDWIQG